MKKMGVLTILRPESEVMESGKVNKGPGYKLMRDVRVDDADGTRTPLWSVGTPNEACR